MNLEPGISVGTFDWGRDAPGDFNYFAELLETVGLIGPDKAEQSGAALIQRWIDGIQIAATALDNTDITGYLEKPKVVPPKVQARTGADFQQSQRKSCPPGDLEKPGEQCIRATNLVGLDTNG